MLLFAWVRRLKSILINANGKNLSIQVKKKNNVNDLKLSHMVARLMKLYKLYQV